MKKWCGYWWKDDNGNLHFHALSNKCKDCSIITHEHIKEVC